MKLKEIVLGIAIIILTVFVVVYGIQTFYPEQEYSDFCEEFKTAEIIDTQTRCEETGGKWITSNEMYDGERPLPVEKREAWCDRDYTCRQDYEAANKTYSRNIFIIATILGIILIVIGAILFELESVGAGIMGGGIVTLLYGATNYWRYSGNAFRFIISIIGLTAVIYLAYWLNKKK